MADGRAVEGGHERLVSASIVQSPLAERGPEVCYEGGSQFPVQAMLPVLAVLSDASLVRLLQQDTRISATISEKARYLRHEVQGQHSGCMAVLTAFAASPRGAWHKKMLA